MQPALEWITEKGGRWEADPQSTRHLFVECASGHRWHPTIYNLANHHWCPTCYGNVPHTIEIMQAIATARGGACLSAAYAGLKTPLQWRCSFGHEWSAIPNNVKNHGSWCPHCVTNIGEELVRASLEEALPGEAFDRTRSEPWMEGLELDGCNLKLRLAFEYQGKQHFERVPHFQRAEGDFEAQLERDQLTRERCEDEWVVLLEVPHTISFQSIRAFVRKELALLAYDTAPEVGSASDFYDRVRSTRGHNATQFAKAVAIITRKGGVCLSTQYVGYRVPLQIRCGYGHEFEASLEAIDQPESRGPRFCPECGGTQRKEDDEIQAAVAACGFTLTRGGFSKVGDDGRSRRYIGVCCPAGHDYDVRWENFKPVGNVPAKGCALCHRERLSMLKRGNISQWMIAKGVTAPNYRNQAFQHEWTCANGHVFTASYSCLKQKATPCTLCFLVDFGKSKGFELLTPWTAFCGPTTPLVWQHTACGTRFTASLGGIGRKKRFCPKCET